MRLLSALAAAALLDGGRRVGAGHLRTCAAKRRRPSCVFACRSRLTAHTGGGRRRWRRRRRACSACRVSPCLRTAARWRSSRGPHAPTTRSRCMCGRLAALVPQALTPTDEGAPQPFWSADGRSIGFVSGGRLRKIAASGGPPQDLCPVERFLRRRLESGRRDHLRDVERNLPRPAEGGTPEAVTTLDTNETGHYWPAFLPDGRRFLYSAWSGESSLRAVYAAALDSKDRTRILAVESNALYSGTGHLLFHRGKAVYAQPSTRRPWRSRASRRASPMKPVSTKAMDADISRCRPRACSPISRTAAPRGTWARSRTRRNGTWRGPAAPGRCWNGLALRASTAVSKSRPTRSGSPSTVTSRPAATSGSSSPRARKPASRSMRRSTTPARCGRPTDATSSTARCGAESGACTGNGRTDRAPRSS